MTENPQQPYGNPAFEGQGEHAAGQQGSKYGTEAYGSGAFGQEMAEPKKFGLLKKLTLASLSIYVVSSIVSLLTSGNEALLDAELEKQSAQMGIPMEQLEEGMEIGMAIAIGGAVVALVIALVVYLLVFFGLRKSKNWARILGTVFAAIGTLFTLYGLTSIGTMMSVAPVMGTVSIVITVLFLIVNIFWIVTAFSKDVNAYLSARA
ncbi:hypothetical protein [Citricoccus nitrophenolicus]|uniref:hypothetical protein n=1 Tax=Citricoccus nitrophenolicus TaxID=863575 RepID=UPI0039B3DA32